MPIANFPSAIPEDTLKKFITAWHRVDSKKSPVESATSPEWGGLRAYGRYSDHSTSRRLVAEGPSPL